MKRPLPKMKNYKRDSLEPVGSERITKEVMNNLEISDNILKINYINKPNIFKFEKNDLKDFLDILDDNFSKWNQSNKKFP